MECGGTYFDSEVFALANKYANEKGKPLELEKRWGDYLACKQLKEDLSTKQISTAPLSNNDTFSLTRKDFEVRISPFLDKTLEACDELLRNANYEWVDLNNVLLVGGSTAIPLVVEKLKKHAISFNAANLPIVRNLTNKDKKSNYDHLFAVCLGGISTKIVNSAEVVGAKLIYNGKEYPLHEGINTIGRSPGQNIQISVDNMKGFSREHFIIKANRTNSGEIEYKLQNKSKFGTYVGGWCVGGEYGLVDEVVLGKTESIGAGSLRFIFKK